MLRKPLIPKTAHKRLTASEMKRRAVIVATANAREAIARFIDGNADRLQGLLDEIAVVDGPLAAFRCITDLMEYHIPKLARVTHAGDGGAKPLVVIVSGSAEDLL